jgi:hypothetical protein
MKEGSLDAMRALRLARMSTCPEAKDENNALTASGIFSSARTRMGRPEVNIGFRGVFIELPRKNHHTYKGFHPRITRIGANFLTLGEDSRRFADKSRIAQEQ